MPSISETFKPGDLIYGLNEKRTTYQTHYLKNPTMTFATIDEYHRTIIQMPGSAMNIDFFARPDMFPKVPRYLAKQDVALPKGAMTHTGYWDGLSRTKYSPVGVSGMGKDQKNWPKLQKETGEKLEAGKDNSANLKTMEYYLAIRRSCKYGLAHVCATTAETIRIHFALDGIDLKRVAGKELDKDNRLGITGSELRFAYRNRDKFEATKKVLFYIHGTQVSPPWRPKTADDIKLATDVKGSSDDVPGYTEDKIWEAYEQTRVAKVK